MQLRRAVEIVDKNDNNIMIYYKENPVNIISIDNNIGTAYVETLSGSSRFEVDLEQLNEVHKYM